MTTQEELLDRYFACVVQQGVFSKHIGYYLGCIFKNVDFRDRKLLDIGGGSGWISYYAACQGAEKVVCLEPEQQGSAFGVNDKFKSFSNCLPEIRNVFLVPKSIQQYGPCEEQYDIIVLHNSINHLDEEACIRLKKDSEARRSYLSIFRNIADRTIKAGKIVIVDASRYNLFGLLGIKNPYVPSIEWEKHQSPRIWIELLSDAGFSKASVAWLSFNRLGELGRLFFANALSAFFLNSYFCLAMEKT